MASSSESKLDIVIVGGGIGGLCLAVALRDNPALNVKLYEKTEAFDIVAGAGMSIWPRIVSIFRKWGIEEKFTPIVTQHRPPDVAFQMSKANQPEPGDVFWEWKIDGGISSFHRAHLLDILHKSVPEGTVKFKKGVASYTNREDGKIDVNFMDGTTETCDLLVASDGLYSTVREVMYKKLIEAGKVPSTTRYKPVWTGSALFRAMIPYAPVMEKYPGHKALRSPQMYCGHNQRFVCYPMNHRTQINTGIFFSLPEKEGTDYEEAWAWQPVEAVTKEWLAEKFKDWDPEVRQLIELMPDKPPKGPTRWPMYALEPLPTYLDGRALLIGDAAHATTPHWGFGAGSSVEDASMLADILNHPGVTRSTLPIALELFDELRVVEGRRIIEGSRRVGLVYEFNPPEGDDLDACVATLTKAGEWIGKTSPHDDARKAIETLEQRLAAASASTSS